jgi:hypothetical protein
MRRTSLISTSFLLLIPFVGSEAVTSRNSGNWSDSTTWSGGVLPGTSQSAIITTHTVTVDGFAASASSITIRSGGTLRFSRTASSQLEVTAGDLRVENGGTLDLGTALSPIPTSFTATLILSKPTSTTRRGLRVDNGGTFTSYGANKSPFGQAVAGPSAGATSVSLPAANTAGWAAGDQIVIAKTQISNVVESETATLTGVGGGDPAVLSWTGGLAYDHPTTDIPLLVANLTRNVVVRSSGTTVTGPSPNVSYIRVASPNFSAVLTEFVALGSSNTVTNTAGPEEEEGLTFESNGKVSMSSCSVRDGYAGVNLLFASERSSVRNSVFHNNENAPVAILSFTEIHDDSVVGNAFVGNRRAAVNVENTGGTLVKDNWAVDNAFSFYFYQPPGPLRVENNRIYCDRESAILYGGTRTTFLNNEIAGSYEENRAMDLGGNNNGALLVGNNIHHNRGLGAQMGASDNILVGNHIWSNGYGGLYLSGHGTVFASGSLGYDPAGNAAPNDNPIRTSAGANGNIYFEVGAASTVFVNARIHPGMDVDAGQFSGGMSLLSYAHNGVAGETRLWGDHLILAGNLTLDRAADSFSAMATTPTWIRGGNGTAGTVSALTGYAVSQLVTVRYTGSAWRVEGSSSGYMGDHTGGALTFPRSPVSGPVQFTLSFTLPGGAEADDMADFAMIGPSGDAGVQKKLLFSPAASSFNGGKSRLTVAPGAELVLRGSAAEPTLVQRSGTSGSYTFISSGTFTAEHADFRHMDSSGVQLTGSAGVSLSSSTFDELILSGTANAYITARTLTSVGTWHGMTFGGSQINPVSGQNLYNVRITGTDGVAWSFQGWSGSFSGPNNESDPNGHVHWLLQPPVNLSAATSPGRIDLSWSHPISPTAFYRSPYRVLAGSVSASGPWLVDTTTTSTSYSLTGLLDDTLYYLEVQTQGTTGAAAAGTALTAKTPDLVPPAAPSGLTADTGAGLGEIDLVWTSPGDNNGTKVLGANGAYAVQYSLLDPVTVIWSTSSAQIVSTGPVAMGATMTRTITGLTQEADYYVRVWLMDPDGNWSAYSSTASATPRLNPPTGTVTAPLISMSARMVARDALFSLSFNRGMDATSLQSSVEVRRLRDNRGNAVNEVVSGSVAGSGSAYQVNHALLAGNSLYEVTVGPGAADTQGNVLGSSVTAQFSTVMNAAEDNLWDGGGGVRVLVPAGAPSQDIFISAADGNDARALAATAKLMGNTGDATRRPISTPAALAVMDSAGAATSGAFQKPVSVYFSYSDVNDDGFVDNVIPRVRVKTLAIHWLDEVRNAWVKLPSTVDSANHQVSAPTPHFTTFALIGQADAAVADAHVFPVPYKLSAGGNMTFTNLPSSAAIEIYSVDGRKVKELAEGDGDARLDWDVKDDNGETLNDGLYFYRIKSGGNEKTGDFMIIR